MNTSFLAVIWVIFVGCVAKVTRFLVQGMLSNERVVKPLLYVSFILLGINTVLLLYLTIYLPRIKGITDSSAWDAVCCSRVVPTRTIFGILTGLLLIRSIWHVWGFLLPLEFFGCLYALHFVPWFRFLLIWEQVDQLDRNREDLDPFLTRRSCDDGSAKKRKNQ